MNILNEDNINYQSLNQIRAQARTVLTTREEYILWLREWKTNHRDIVNAIKFLRALKNIAKQEGNTLQVNKLWMRKKHLGTVAKELYLHRVANKTQVKSGKLPRETQMAA